MKVATRRALSFRLYYATTSCALAICRHTMASSQHYAALWWPRIRGDVSAFVRACEVFDRDRCSNPNPRTSLGQLPADNPFDVFYIDIVGGQGSLSLGASPKFILSMIDGLTGWAEAVPIEDQRAVTVAHAVYTEWIARDRKSVV